MGEDKFPEDRRSSERVPMHKHAEVHIIDEEGEDGVQVMNVSEGGVRFVSKTQYEPGQTVDFMIDNVQHTLRVHDCKKLFEGYSVRAEYLD